MKNSGSFSKRVLFSLAVIATLGTGIAVAKPSAFEKSPREEIKAYMEANVLPVLRAQRQKLEEIRANASNGKKVANSYL